jgi:hypothetical protein
VRLLSLREVVVLASISLFSACVLSRARADGSVPNSIPWVLTPIDDAGGYVNPLGAPTFSPVILGHPMNACGAPYVERGWVCSYGYHLACQADAGEWCEKDRDPCDTLTPVKADGGRLQRYYRVNDAGITSEDVPVERRCPDGIWSPTLITPSGPGPYFVSPYESRPINLGVGAGP